MLGCVPPPVERDESAPVPTGAILVRVLTKTGRPLGNVDVVASSGQLVLDRTVTDAEGWAAVAGVDGTDVSAYYERVGHRDWATVMGANPGDFVRVPVLEFGSPPPELPDVTATVTKFGSSIAYAQVGFCQPAPSTVVNSTAVAFTISMSPRCLQDDGTGSVWVSVFDYSGSGPALHGAAMDLEGGENVTITPEAPSLRQVSVEVVEGALLLERVDTMNLWPIRKGQRVARGYDYYSSTSPELLLPAAFEIEDIAPADGVFLGARFYQPGSEWNQRVLLQTAVTNTLTIDGREFSRPAALVLTTTGVPSVAWTHPDGTPLPDWIETAIFWVDASAMRQRWHVMLRGGGETIVHMPPTPDDLLGYRFGDATDFDTGMIMWRSDPPMIDAATAWMGPRPSTYREAMTARGFFNLAP